MIEIKNDLNESCSSNLVFLRENYFQRDSVAISPQKLTLNLKMPYFIDWFPNLSESLEKMNV